MTQKTAFKTSEDKLTRLLREKRGTYTISKDGYISLDMTHPKVRESFERQMKQMRSLVDEGKLVFK